jgi:predicted metalloprotease with PDZ domain
MRSQKILVIAGLVAALSAGTAAWATAGPTRYRFSFPEPEHHWMLVEATFSGLQPGPVELHISRSSPGRYALHEFAKNVYGLTVADGAGRALVATPLNPSAWTVKDHDGTVKATYRVFGDRVDGTYLAVDRTHAHINMPAVILWAAGRDLEPAEITFVRPSGANWDVASQLMPTGDPLVFTAPNLQYLMDSPSEFGTITWRTIRAADLPGATPGDPRVFRLALHHSGSDADADALVDGIRKVLVAERKVYGDFPAYEPGTYTFLADYLSWANGDGMEHRNSTVLTSRNAIAGGLSAKLDTIAHEFFHCWNVERIRPATLEPFDFDRANMSGELWLAEGVTSYYNTLILARAGITPFAEFARSLGHFTETVVTSPATKFRSAEDMSRLAPFVDAAAAIDRTNWGNTFISYYTYGGALGIGFDLAIREHTKGRATLDDFMRAMWKAHGLPGGSRPGYVDHPYTVADIRARLAEVTGDRAFADDLMTRFVEGHEVMDYAHLFGLAGLVLRHEYPGAASLGPIAFDRNDPSSLRIVAPTRIGTAAYAAGLDVDDEITKIANESVSKVDDLNGVLKRHKPGDRVTIAFVRHGKPESVEATLQENIELEVVPVETTGGEPTEAQKAFRAAWAGQ